MNLAHIVGLYHFENRYLLLALEIIITFGGHSYLAMLIAW